MLGGIASSLSGLHCCVCVRQIAQAHHDCAIANVNQVGSPSLFSHKVLPEKLSALCGDRQLQHPADLQRPRCQAHHILCAKNSFERSSKPIHACLETDTGALHCQWSPLAPQRYKRHDTEGEPHHRGHDLTSALADAQSRFHSPKIFSDLAGAEVGFCFASSLRARMTSSSPLLSLMASSRA